MADPKLEQQIDDALAYPILTEEISYPSGAPAAAPGAPGTTDLGQKAESAVREVLGWRPKSGDPKAFLAALNKAFDLRQVEGHVEWKWTQRNYAAQADLGELTGAQASIYQRAKAALDESLPLLDGLYALDPAADPEDTEAIRMIVRSEWSSLVAELAAEGGPRVAMVDQYFLALLGPNPNPSRPENVQGDLLRLKDRFGMRADLVNTIDEERNLTNFRILVDYVLTFQQSWKSNKRFFERAAGSPKFLGTQLVLLSRELGVIAESVEEVKFAMDSVFVGPAERQTIQLDCGLTIAELLDWIQQFASVEGVRLIQDAGKDGVITAGETLKKLLALVSKCLIA